MVSFIVPAYKAEKTIKRCLDSILNQQESGIDFEVIVVDDGSKDKTKEIIEKYPAKLKKKINYFWKRNGGVSDARNYGVKKAKGDYIIFVDSDDYINKRLLLDIRKYINKGIELIKWNPMWIYEGELEKIYQPVPDTFESLTGEEGFNRLWYKDPMLCCLWNYCFKKELIMEFPKGMLHEDYATIPLMILRAKTFTHIDKYEYFYVQTDNSIMRGSDETKEKKKLEDYLVHTDNLLKQIKEENVSEYTKENMGILCANALLVSYKGIVHGNNMKFFKEELKKRKISKLILPRDFKQLVKRNLIRIKFA